MALSTTDSRFVYDGDAATVAFSFPRKFVSTADLKVYLYDEDDDTWALQALNTHYTVAGAGLSNGIYATGTVTFTAAPGSDKKVVIYRDPALTQEFDFSGESDPIAALNRRCDLLMMQLQRLMDRSNRSLRLHDGDFETTLDALPAKTDLANTFLAFDAAGEPIASEGDAGSITISSALTPVVQETTLARAMARLGGPNWTNAKNPLYGVTGDGATEDTTALGLVRDAAGVGGIVYVPPGTYIINDLYLSVANQTWIFDDRAILKQKAASTGGHVRISAAGVRVLNVTSDGNRDNVGANGGSWTISADDVEINFRDCYEHYVDGVNGTSIQRWKITGKIRDFSRTGIFIDMPENAAADLEGGYIDVDIDCSNEPNSGQIPAGIIIRGDETSTVRYFTGCTVKGRVKCVDDAYDTTGPCVELRQLKNGTVDLETIGGSCGLSTDNLAGVWHWKLQSRHASTWGIEVGGTIGEIHGSGTIDMRAPDGSARGDAAILSGTGTGSGSFTWTGPIGGVGSNGGGGKLILHRAARRLIVNGDADASNCDYVIYDQEAGNWSLNCTYAGGNAADYIAYMANSPGGALIDGRIAGTGFVLGLVEIANTTAITTDYVRVAASVEEQLTAFVTSLSGGGAIGDNLSVDRIQLHANWRGAIRNWKQGNIYACGVGSPESTLAAGVGSTAVRTDGATGTDIFHKRSGTSTTGWKGLPTFDEGSYTPTLTDVANTDARTPFTTYYSRVGNTVHVWGRVDIDPTAATPTVTTIGMSLPIASNLTAAMQLTGTGVCPNVAGMCLAIYGDPTNDRAELSYIAPDGTSRDFYFNFSYVVA